MNDLTAALDAIEARQSDCQTYNKLAHEDVPLLLALSRRLLAESEASE